MELTPLNSSILAVNPKDHDNAACIVTEHIGIDKLRVWFGGAATVVIRVDDIVAWPVAS